MVLVSKAYDTRSVRQRYLYRKVVLPVINMLVICSEMMLYNMYIGFFCSEKMSYGFSERRFYLKYELAEKVKSSFFDSVMLVFMTKKYLPLFLLSM